MAELTQQIRDNNIEKGFRPTGGGPGDNTWGDYVALLLTEVGEILEAYRDRQLASYTTATGKPDDVASEVADCVIRVIDMADVFSLYITSPDITLEDIGILLAPGTQSFGDWVAWLGYRVGLLWQADLRGTAAREHTMVAVLRALQTFAQHWGINLTAEVERKMAYNVTRPYLHGRMAL
jgi:NTP pyrophosphatase (non-canonical NTP hydrolase)